MIARLLFVLISLSFSIELFGQTLTISSVANSGSYSYSAGTLTVSGTANIQATEIQTWLGSGDLSIVGSTSALTVNVNQAITSTTVGSDLTIGAATNTGAITISSDISIAGGLVVRGGNVQINSNITSTATGDLFFQGLSDTYSVRLATGKTIAKTAGTGLLTFQGDGAINDYVNVGSILASGSAQLDVVMIAEMDAGTAGLYNISTGNITTNGGKIWMGAGPKTRVWNGLSVGSTGVPGNGNANGIEITGNISSNGGDILLWSFLGSNARLNGYGDIVAEGLNRTIDAGSGDIILMTRYNDFEDDLTILTVNTTAALILTPASSANFDLAVDFSGTLSSGTFTGSGGLERLKITNFTSLGELMVGSYNGTGISGDTPFVSVNTADLNLNSAISLAAKVSFYGGDINLNQSINTTGAAALGDILCKASGDINLAASRSITTSGGDVILWANSDNANSGGSVALRSSSSIVTGSNSVTGGKVWIGGGSDGGTWNGLAVGAGYAVPGTIYTPSSGGSNLQAGVYLEGCSISSFGGNVKILGNVASTGRAITTYGTISIDSKLGDIEIEGNATNNALTDGDGILFGIHDITIASVINLSSSASGTAITVRGFSRGTGDAIGLSGTLNAQSTGTGGILFNGTSYGTGMAIKIGNYYHGKLNAYAASGSITFNGGTKGLEVAAAVTGGITTGPSKLNIGQGGSVTSSSSNVILTGDVISSAASGIAILSSGNVTIQPSGNSFTNAFTFSSPAFSVPSTVSGLTIGKSTNTAAVTIGTAQSIAGPITIFGGDISINNNLISTLSGAAILLKSVTNISAEEGLTIRTNNGNFVCWSDSDNNSSGSIYLKNNVTINTANGSTSNNLSSGGKIVMAGGADDAAIGGTASDGIPDGNAFSSSVAGLRLGSDSGNHTQLYSGGGDIVLYGRSTFNAGSENDRVGLFTWGKLTANSGNGAIIMNGQSTAYYGINFTISTGNNISTGDSYLSLRSNKASGDAIKITGTSTNNYGIVFNYNNPKQLLATGGGNILINGVSGSSSFYGIFLQNPDFLASSGSITLDGGVNGVTFAAAGATFGSKAGTPITSSTANVIISTDRINVGGSAPVSTTGGFTYQPSSATFPSALSWPVSSNFTFNGISGLTLGKGTNTQNITISSATTVAGPISLFGGNLTLTGALTATNSDILLHSVGTVTQATALTANRLNLSGTGTFTLQHASNNIGVIAGGTSSVRLGNVAFRDAVALEIGTVTNTGIFSSGTVLVETEAGNLTLAQSINTSSTSTSAIILNASRPLAAGSGTGGNILVSGSPTLTYGSGGMAKLFSGYDAASTGLTALAGGSANTRAPFDENSTVTPTLSANNTYAIYRVLAGTGDLTIVSSGGDAEGSTWTYSNGAITTLTSPVNILNTVVQTKLGIANLSIEANKITFSANITSNTNKDLRLLSKTHILQTLATTITTQGGDVLFASNVDDATDGESTTNGYMQLRNGITITTNGGNITFGGGNTSGTDYAFGSSAEDYTEGIRFDTNIALNSGGGNISLKGKSYARSVQAGYGASGVGFYFFSGATGTIQSGAGTITIDGFSQTSTSSYASGFYCMHNLTITSANTSANAITIIGKATGASGDAWGIESESVLSILATGSGGGISINTSKQITDNFDAVFRQETNILAVSGPIDIKTGQLSGTSNGYLYLNGNLHLGSKAGSGISSSSSNINLQVDRYSIVSGVSPKIATSGQVTIQPNATSFGDAFPTSSFHFNQNSQVMSGLTIGKSGNLANVNHQTTAITVAGPVSIYGGDLAINENITSTLLSADVLLQATGAISLATNKTIQTNAGDITFKSNASGIAVPVSSSTIGAITLADGSSLLSTGGNITLGGNYTGAKGVGLYAATNRTGGSPGILLSNATLTAAGGNINIYGKCVSNYDDGIRLQANMNTTGAGTIGIYGESYGGLNTSTNPDVFFGGITFITAASTIETDAGNINVEATLTNTLSSGTYALNFYRTTFSTGTPNKHIQLLSKSGDIQVTGDRGSTSAGGMGSSSWGNIYVGSPLAANSWTATGNIKFSYSSFVGAANNGFIVKTTGGVTYEPASTSFTIAQIFPYNANYTLAQSASSLTIGKPSNTANLTMNAATTTVAGNITIYGGELTLNGNITTTNNGNISLYSDNALAGLSSTRTLTAAGVMTYAPQGTSFGSAVTYPISNLTVNSSGLTIGKSGNLANITIGTATSVNGPITLHGGDLTLTAGLTTTNNSTGNITLNGTKLLGAGAIALATNRTLTANLSGDSEYTGDISGTTISFTKTGAGILTLNPTNTLTFSAATITTGGLTIAATKQLTVTGTLTNDATFTLKDGATFVQATSGTSITGTGTYNVEKALTGNTSSWTNTSGRFWYMGVPMKSVARNNYGIPGSTTNRVWSYAESTKSYTEVTDGSVLLSAGTGYVYRRSTDGTLTFTATGANGLRDTDFSASGLTKTTGNTAGVHLISNPYMAYVDWQAIYTASASTNIDPTYYIRTNNTNNISAVISYNASTNQVTNNSSIETASLQPRYIAPMQSIWVRVLGNAGSTGTVNMTRSMLSHQSGNVGLKSSTVFPTLARVNLVDGNNFDQLLVYLNSDMSNEVDQYDSEKMAASGTVQIYTMSSNKKLVMNGLKNNKKKVSVPLYLELPETKSYTLQLSEYQVEDGLILLEDKQEGTMQDFTINENYTFYANSGLLQNRFVLHFILPNAELATQGPSNNWVEAVGSYTEGSDVEIFNDDRGNIEITLNQAAEQKVEGTVFVTDMNGKEVYNGQLEGIITAIELDVPSGIYYLTVQSGTLIEKKKVFIQE